MTEKHGDFLRGLEQLDWTNVHHAYGPATDVPELLRALTSPSNETRSFAWHELYGNLWHQGTIYEATALAVPFLIQLLADSQIADKAEILAYLAVLFNGQGYWEVHGKGSRPDKPCAPELERILTQERSWGEATRAAIRQGARTYFHLLQCGDLRTQRASICLLGLIGDTDLEIIDEILKTDS